MSDADHRLIEPDEAIERVLIRPFYELGVQLDFWRNRAPPNHKQWEIAFVERAVPGFFQRHPELEPNDDPDYLATKFYVRQLDAIGAGILGTHDAELSDAAEDPEEMYRDLLARAPWPSVQVELGQVLLHGIGFQPLTAFDFEHQQLE